MAKVFILCAVVLLIAVKAKKAESCTYNSDCILHDYGEHCCEDGQCYSESQTCPVIEKLASGIIAAIVIGIIVFIAIIITVIACCCCACCQRHSPGHIVVAQPPYQQFGVTTCTTQTNAFSAGPPVPQVQAHPPPYMQAPPPQMKPL